VTAVDLIVRVLLFTGVTVVVMASVAAVWLRGTFVRLHMLAPVTAVGGPLIGLALAIENGWGLTTALILFTVFLLALSGPVVEVATARVNAQREGIVPLDAPP
jgi:multisubunit Na+/H+ antiporter MnhG subunit